MAEIITDRGLVKEHYSPALKAWVGDLGDGVHDGTANDPRIGIIRVKTASVTYSVTTKNFVSRMADVAQGTLTGQMPSINKLREITESEAKQWRSSHNGVKGEFKGVQ